jgi:MoaA/NifB/PqqE/SkfB family radical SAM enzyme
MSDVRRRSTAHPLLPNLRWRLSWYLRRTRLRNPPYYVNIEPNNVCNLRCSICSMDGSRPGGFMDPSLFRRVADDAAASGVTEARLFLGGEPLLHPDIAELVRYAEGVGLITCIHTNAVRLDESMSDALLDAGLSQISFSFDGETAEEYERVRVGARFDQVLANILRFLELKKARGLRLPETTLQMIRPANPPERSIEAGRRQRFRGRRLPPAVPSCISRRFAALFDDLPLDHWLVLPPHNWAGELSEIVVRRGKVFFPCQALWQSLSIAWDGSVLLCCGDLNGRIVLGDLTRETVMQVWNSPRLVGIRAQHQRADTLECSLCVACGANWRNHHPLISDLWKLVRGRLV